MSHSLRNVENADEQVAELTKECTATSNRIRGLLTHIHPALERVIGRHLDHPAMLELRSASLVERPYTTMSAF